MQGGLVLAGQASSHGRRFIRSRLNRNVSFRRKQPKQSSPADRSVAGPQLSLRSQLVPATTFERGEYAEHMRHRKAQGEAHKFLILRQLVHEMGHLFKREVRQLSSWAKRGECVFGDSSHSQVIFERTRHDGAIPGEPWLEKIPP